MKILRINACKIISECLMLIISASAMQLQACSMVHTRSSCREMAGQTDEKLSRRAEVFRSKLIEEFQLLDCLSEQGHLKTPVYSSSNIIEGA